jgi:hypothetical protein
MRLWEGNDERKFFKRFEETRAGSWGIRHGEWWVSKKSDKEGSA